MLTSTLTTFSLAAVAAGAMALASTAPASAFTLAAPSLAAPVAQAQIDHVWWDRWGRWHPNGPAYYAPPVPFYGDGYGYGYGYGRHCWRGYYGRLHCSW
jgi:hypothetical protein